MTFKNDFTNTDSLHNTTNCNTALIIYSISTCVPIETKVITNIDNNNGI